MCQKAWYNRLFTLMNDTNSLEERAKLWQLVSQKYSCFSFNQLLNIHQEIFRHDEAPITWLPDPDHVEHSNINRLMKKMGFTRYKELYDWSVVKKSHFWEETIKTLDIQFKTPYQGILDISKGNEQANWLPGAELNITASCFNQDNNRTAVIVRNEAGTTTHLTYGELEKACNKLANGFINRGFTSGDRVVLYLPLCLESVVAYLGLIKAGLVPVLIADSFSPEELNKRSELAQAKAIVAADAYLYGGKKLPIYDKVKQANSPFCVVVPMDGLSYLREGDVHWDDFLGEDQLEYAYGDPYSLTSILFSSGTTKEPKVIPWTQLTPIKCGADAHFHHDIHPDDVVTWTTGMGWMMGPWTIYAALLNKATLALYVGAAAGKGFGSFMEEVQITMLGTIPSLVKAWRKTGMMEQYHWPVKVFSSTGEPSNADDYFYLMWLAKFNAPVIEYCGGTEIGGGYVTGTMVQPAVLSAFSTPALGMDLVLLNEEQEELKPGETGEVFINPPSIGLSQHLLNRDHHEEYFTNTPVGKSGEHLRKHGDAITQLETSILGTHFYKSQGRADDTMNLGGIKVSSVELETAINQHEQVFECAAVAVSPPGGGPEQLVIYFIPGGAIDEEGLKQEMQQLITEQINPLFRIKAIRSLDKLPRTASNKVMRRVLRKQYMEENHN